MKRTAKAREDTTMVYRSQSDAAIEAQEWADHYHATVYVFLTHGGFGLAVEAFRTHLGTLPENARIICTRRPA